MPARRTQSLQHGSAKAKPVVWHREHRSKRGRTKPKRDWGNIKLYRDKLAKLRLKELEDDNVT